jgi:hypothetical protein
VTDVTQWVVQRLASVTLTNVETRIDVFRKWAEPTKVAGLLLLRTRCLSLLDGSDLGTDCRRGTDRNTGTVCSRTFKVDLRDWTYLRSVPTKRSKHTLKVSMQFVTKSILDADDGVWLGQYSGDPSGIGPKPQIVLYVRASVPWDVSSFDAKLRDAVETTRHELQHYSQSLLQTELGLRDEAGLPPRSARERDFDINASELPHKDRDMEFQTNLQTAVSKIRRRLQRVSPQSRRDLLREILSSYVGEHYRSSAKGRAAASTLYAAVADLLPSS